jgi:hypothetical protein
MKLLGVPAFLVFRVGPDAAAVESWPIADDQLEDTIAEQDAPRFRLYAAPGDFYTFGDLLVLKLGRRFTDDDWKP